MASFYNNYYRYYKPYPPHILNRNLHQKSTTSSVNQEIHELPSKEENGTSSEGNEKSSRYYSFGPINFKNPFFNDIEEPIFEILGIQLYLDDIIILGLLFFLYQEGVQDEMLYIALILLLLS